MLTRSATTQRQSLQRQSLPRQAKTQAKRPFEAALQPPNPPKKKIKVSPLKMEDGVYHDVHDVHYTVMNGSIFYFNTNRSAEGVKKLKLCSNSDLLFELHCDIGTDENFCHVSSDYLNIDGFGRVLDSNEDCLVVEMYSDTVSNRENGTRTYDTEMGCEETIEWKYLDSFQALHDELPWWTDSEPDSDSSDSDDSDDSDDE